MGSSRLPGKVLSDIYGKPMLLRQVERIKRSKLVKRVIIATSTSNKDDKIVSFCQDNKIEYFRGPENDVLKRIVSLFEENPADIHVECYGDSPLIDPEIIDDFVKLFLELKNKTSYISSAIKTSYPPGLEVTVYCPEILKKVDKMIPINDPLREHVGYNITRFPEKFNICSIKAPNKFNAPNFYLEVDSKEDLNVIRKIYNYFISNQQEIFGLRDIINFLKKNPNIIIENSNIERRWKKFRK